MSETPHVSAFHVAFSRVMGLFGGLLVASTWRLWTPQVVFPRVPLFGALVNAPDCLDAVAGFGLFAALTGMVVLPSTRLRWAWGSYLVFAGALFALDQHRLQPWAYQLWLVAILLSVFPGLSARRACRGLLVSIYLFSALSKLDYQFAHTLGQQFLSQLGGWVGWELAPQVTSLRVGLALAFPLTELVLAVGLCRACYRRWAVPVAISLHAVLILLLGPWGLGHHWGVLLWNLFFVVQLVVLYTSKLDATPTPTGALSSTADADQTSLATAPSGLRTTIIRWGLAGMLFLPVLEPLGYWDHWPAWQLYAPRNSRASVWVLTDRIGDLPPDLTAHLRSGDPSALFTRLDLDAWSLEVLGAPIYPQDRFQLGVAASVLARCGLERGFQVVGQQPAHRLNGKREQSTYRDRDQLQTALADFHLNAEPHAARGSLREADGN